MTIFLIVLGVIIAISLIVGGIIVWKMKHLVSPELVDATMKIYLANSLDAQPIEDVHKLAILTSISSSRKGLDPITITPATLNGESITLMTLGGTQKREGQATTMDESKLASQGKENDYLKAVVSLFEDDTVPRDKPVLISGISLGGMIAQQILSVKSIVDNYDIKAIVTFGSPLTMPFDRHGIRVVRFVDKYDIVPKLGEIATYKNRNKKEINSANEAERILKIGSHKGGIEAHALSYISDECWDEYDFLGDKSGTNTLILDDGLHFYPAPKQKQN